MAVGRLEPFDPKAMSTYRTLKNPSNLPIGTSLCRLGFPFHSIKASYDEEKDSFVLPPGTLPVPRFPIDDIYTRNVVMGKSKDGKYEIKFLETSSAGLRGQNGGPIFDTQGRVWAIQSRTVHFPLGFSPKVKKNGQEVEENQFLNVGLGVHPIAGRSSHSPWALLFFVCIVLEYILLLEIPRKVVCVSKFNQKFFRA